MYEVNIQYTGPVVWLPNDADVTNNAIIPCWALQTMRTLENERFKVAERSLRVLYRFC